MNRYLPFGVFIAVLVLLTEKPAATPRTYLEVSGGINVLMTNLDGDVVNERVLGHVELGIGTQLTDKLLFEASFGRLGTMEQNPVRSILGQDELRLPDSEKVFRLEANPMLFRLRYAESGLREGYLKPEFSLGLGLYSVTRWLRNPLGIPPASTSDLLPVVELGVSMLVVFQKNWMGYVGPRYVFMQRRDLVQDTRHLDGVSVLLGFRFFLNSPRDEYEPIDD